MLVPGMMLNLQDHREEHSLRIQLDSFNDTHVVLKFRLLLSRGDVVHKIWIRHKHSAQHIIRHGDGALVDSLDVYHGAAAATTCLHMAGGFELAFHVSAVQY